MFTQQAREMVLEIIREKDQADFRGIRGDFGARVGGGSIEVCLPRRSVPKQTRHTLVSSLTLREGVSFDLIFKARVRVRKDRDSGDRGP